jgi:Protein of unknown function (DUF2948)
MAPDDSVVLKLRAEDADDLAVISACLQDSLVPVRDLAYDAECRSFLLVANRFRWEDGLRRAAEEGGFQRTLCGITFSDVVSVSYSGFRRSDDGCILSLLAIRPESGAIRLEFSGGAAIRLEVERILCGARDLGEPWPTPWRPHHEVDEPL